MKSQKVQIFGLRCSGTNYLERWLEANFQNVQIVNFYAFKHLWNAQLIRPIPSYDDGILILILVRNPFDWLRSVHREPHHCPELVGLTFSTFIRSPLNAYQGVLWNSKIDSIRNQVMSNQLIESFQDILDLRNKKLELFHSLSSNKNCFVMSYEALRDDPNQYYQDLKKKFNLISNNQLASITEYKQTLNPYKRRPAPRIDKKDLEHIKSCLNWRLEQEFGYDFNKYNWDTYFNQSFYEYRIKRLFEYLRFYFLGPTKYREMLRKRTV